ncbi:MAG: Endothelin-converting enzyme [Bacteroidota bacterium]|jgi:putative endopeptidase
MKQLMSVLTVATLIAVGSSNSGCMNSSANKGIGIETANFDSTSNPTDDFFSFANGGWIKSNPIPDDQVRWGTFNILRDNNKTYMRELAEAAAANKSAAKGSPDQLVGDFWQSAMDTVAIEKTGLAPIRPEQQAIDAIKDIKGVLSMVARMQSYGAGPLFGFYPGQDPKNSEVVVPQIYQGGISLPDRDYYLKDDARSKMIREEFLKHVTAMFTLSGTDAKTAAANAAVVMRIETELAKASMTRVELRDPFKTYNKVTIAGLDSLTPSLKWADMLEGMGVPKRYDYLVLGQPEFLKAMEKQLSTAGVSDWKTYLHWHLLHYADNLTTYAMEMEAFRFYSQVLNGQKQMQPRWKRVVDMTDGLLGDAMGQMYVAKYFPPDAKKKADELVSNLIAVYDERIKQLDWMSDATKQKALDKLHSIMRKIGYPDKWKDYKGLEIARDNYFQNVVNASLWLNDFAMNKIGQPVDRTEWGMTPPTVNAYYNPSMNEIVFPAGILQPPFFNAKADDAVNYGGIGAVIGHEITHGFDDEGRNFDAKGNLSKWWLPEDSAKFMSKAKLIVDQFNGFTVLDTLHVNGELTLGENIADLGGISIAYEAFKRTEQGKSDKKIDGLTSDQRFFIGFATVWAGSIRPEAAAQRIITDPHSPAEYRVNGTLSNVPAFYSAFGVKEGDKLFRPDTLRAKIW